MLLWLMFGIPALGLALAWLRGEAPMGPPPGEVPLLLALTQLFVFWRRKRRSQLLDGRYQLGVELGRGGMARVFRALDTSCGREVAVKLLQPPTGKESETIRQLRECCIYQQLDHPGIVQLLDYQLTGQGPSYLVLELCQGLTLRQRLADGPLTFETVRPWLRQLGEALDYAHEKGLVHRDIKPENILIDDQDRLRLIDFGLACKVQSCELEGRSTVGTLGYMAPEQLVGEASPASDQYALAVVTVEILTGRHPLGQLSPQAWIQQQLQERPPLSAWPESAPQELRRLLDRMLTRSPEERPRDWWEWLRLMA